MPAFIPDAVTVADVAKHLKSTPTEVETSALDLNLYIGQDWRGHAAMSVQDAAGLVSGVTARTQAHERLFAEHVAMSERWNRDRDLAVEAASAEAYDDAIASGKGNARAVELGVSAGRAAGAEWESDHARPTFQGAETDIAQPRYPQPSGVLRKAVAAWTRGSTVERPFDATVA